MPRGKREWYPGAVYHIIMRGVRRLPIFFDDQDYEVYLRILKKALNETSATLHAYCLMSNHIHLMIETRMVKIGVIMKMANQNYAMYLNQKYDMIGHVFANRYKSILVLEDRYFLQVSRYIHLNPVKAKIVSHPEDYRWSSYQTIMGIKEDGVTSSYKTLNFFEGDVRHEYSKFVLRGTDPLNYS